MAKGFLLSNLKWTFSKSNYSQLLQTPTTEQQLFVRLESFAASSNPDGMATVNLYPLSFDLDEVALFYGKSAEILRLKSLLPRYVSALRRLSVALRGAFPSIRGKVRLEALCEIYAECTQLTRDTELLCRYKAAAVSCCKLTSAEVKHFDDFMSLAACRYYCAVFSRVRKGMDAAYFISQLSENCDLIRHRYVDNTYYCKTAMKSGSLFAALDCFGDSSVIMDGNRMGVGANTAVTICGRNAVDTFTQYKFGKATANFLAETNAVTVEQQYFLKDCCEFRRVFVTSHFQRNCPFCVTFTTISSGKTAQYFALGNLYAVGLGTHYAAFAAVIGNEIVPLNVESGGAAGQIKLKLSRVFRLSQRQSACITFVTIYAENIGELSEAAEKLRLIGYANCNLYKDEFTEGSLYNLPTNVRCGNNLYEQPLSRSMPRTADFGYRFGNADVATFLDGDGNGATVLKGFLCGVQGDGIYAVSGGKIEKLNCGSFKILPRGVKYAERLGVSAEIVHDDGKNYVVTAEKPCRILWLLPFEEKSAVSIVDGGFSVTSATRKFTIFSDCAVESFTTNALECNPSRLRYKLSGDLSAMQCLAVCFAPAKKATLTIKTENVSSPRPMVEGSMLSVYLNCLGERTVFCFVNGVRRADPLSLAAATYYDAEFVKRAIAEAVQKDCQAFYYDAKGGKIFYDYSLGYALAAVWLKCLTGTKLPHRVENLVNLTLLEQTFDGKERCVQALTLRRLAEVAADKAAVLSKYGQLCRSITSDKGLYAYAQAIGAVELTYPSDKRFRDLVSSLPLPKEWCYVSRLENLFGVRISCGKLTLRPVLEGALPEDLTLNVRGKKIRLTFERSSTRTLYVNSTPCFGSVDIPSLPSDTSITVRY